MIEKILNNNVVFMFNNVTKGRVEFHSYQEVEHYWKSFSSPPTSVINEQVKMLETKKKQRNAQKLKSFLRILKTYSKTPYSDNGKYQIKGYFLR